MSGSFKQLEAPERYYNSNGVSFGYVVRVQGLSRTTYLNYLCGMQHEIEVQGMGARWAHYIISAIFKTVEEAHEAAYRYYHAWHKEYGFEQDNITGKWISREIDKNCSKTVESQIMEFV